VSPERKISYIAPDVTQLKALAHPVRVQMLGMLRLDGPSTATRLAERLGLNTGATSYHLRQLAQHGFVKEDHERGNNRDRWWRAVHESTDTRPSEFADDQSRAVLDAYTEALGYAHLESLNAAFREAGTLPRAWREVATHSDWAIWLTPDRAGELMSRLHGRIAEYAGHAPDDESQADPGAERFMIQLHGFPRPAQDQA